MFCKVHPPLHDPAIFIVLYHLQASSLYNHRDIREAEKRMRELVDFCPVLQGCWLGDFPTIGLQFRLTSIHLISSDERAWENHNDAWKEVPHKDFVVLAGVFVDLSATSIYLQFCAVSISVSFEVFGPGSLSH
jgi:hypothetical protein